MYVTFGISGKCWLLLYCLFFLSDLPLGGFCLLRTLVIAFTDIFFSTFDFFTSFLFIFRLWYYLMEEGPLVLECRGYWVWLPFDILVLI